MSPYLIYLVPIGIVVATVIMAYLVNKALLKLIKRSTDDLNNDPTNYKFMRHLILALIYVIGFSLAVYTIPALKTIASSLLAGAGILAVAVGFASQHALSNVISGMFIVLFKPFRINDRLQLQTFTGIVEDITLRHTVIRDFENKRIIIPNAVISDQILINADFAEEKICKWIDVGISYDSDIDLARAIMSEEITSHPLHIDVRSPEDIEAGQPVVVVRVLQLRDSDVLLRAWAWSLNAANSFQMSCDVLESIKKRIDTEPRVTIPFPHRTVYMMQDNSKTGPTSALEQ